MSNRRQILHVGLGSAACELTVHLANLHGLAGTNRGGDDGDDRQPAAAAPCDLDVTHAVYNKLYVPRMLLVDEGRWMSRDLPGRSPTQTADAGIVTDCWKGITETVQVEPSQGSIKEPTQTDAWNSFFESATVLASSQYSRYRSRERGPRQNSRHVNWDEEEDELMDEDQQEAANRQKQMWLQETEPQVQRQLEDYWSSGRQDSVASTTPWLDYLAPPYHPRSLLRLPTASFEAEHDSYGHTHALPSWLEDDFLEHLRGMLEACDACQGVVVASSRTWGDGLATRLLQEMEQEVPSASRWMIEIANNANVSTNAVSVDQENMDEPTWRTRQVQTVRRGLQNGLALAEHSQHAHAILPLSDSISGVHMAAALEAATLCYRLRPVTSPSSMIALNSYYTGTYGGEFPFGTVPILSFSEFLTCLKPSNAHLMLELDGLLPTTVFSFENLKQGTSLERDSRIKQQRGRSQQPSNALPGLWMAEVADGGVLSAFSPYPTKRILHNQFCLSGALRPASSSIAVGDQARCLMEGMGIRYQPEKSVATIASQSLLQLTEGGYAAGSYWKACYNLGSGTSVMSVLGNTTRSFGYLQRTCNEMKTIFGPRSRGFYNRDVATGILPELEDAENALSLIYNLRDAYSPPEGNNLANDTERYLDE